jgi:hypothetical protein
MSSHSSSEGTFVGNVEDSIRITVCFAESTPIHIDGIPLRDRCVRADVKGVTEQVVVIVIIFSPISAG